MKVTDQLNRTVSIPQVPERIVSLVPSQTELLVDLGLGDKIVGVTKFCIHPFGLKKEKTIIGGTKNFNFEKIKALNPDLIIGNKEENYKEGIEKLEQDYPVWMSDIFNLDNAIKMIQSLGLITNSKEKAEEITIEITEKRNTLLAKKKTIKKAIYLIWKNPYMAAGSNNYINEMMDLNGYSNICNTEEYSRYPELTEEKLKELNPETILLSSEPFPFKQKHIEELNKSVPDACIKLVDGELYSWYGSRIIKALDAFNTTE
jgi:ABC-type Fe3+-hydroxamate transport system substrate-binding protein